MERLTEKRESGAWPKKDWAYEPIAECLDRLAAYEDTGLEPEQITAEVPPEAILSLAAQFLGVEPGRLRELAQAYRDGRCVVLPEGGCEDKDGENALKSAMNTCFYHNNPVTRFIADAVAEKLTRQEAQAALRREQDGNNK